MDSGGGNTGSSDPAKTSTVETATNSLPGCGCSSANNITVRVTPTTGGQFDLQVAKTESVENFKKLISKKLKVPKERICLLHRDRQLREGTLQENQLMDGSRLTLLPSVETGLLAQRPEQSVMQALESLNDTQVNDFLSGKAPLNLTMRLGDHMMLIQLQLSTVTPSSSRRSTGGSGGGSSSTTTTTTTAAASSTSTPAPSPSTAASTSSLTASPSQSPSASPSKSAPFAGGAALPSQLSLASPSLSSVIAASPSLSSVIAAAAASAVSAVTSGSSSFGSGSSSISISSGLGDPTMTNSRTAPSPSIPLSSGFAKAPAGAPAAAVTAASSPRSSSFTTAATSSTSAASAHHPESPAPCPAAAAAGSPHPSPLKFLEEAASFLPKATSSTDCPTAASTSSPSSYTSATSSSSSSSPSSSSQSHPSSSFHTAQPSTSSSSQPSSSSSSPPSQSSSSTAATTVGSTTHACGYGSGASGCKCEAPAAKPMLDTRALAEASRNLTQTLKQLSSEVLTSRSDAAEDSSRGGRRQGAIIESMHHHGKGVYSGTFSGTLNPALQDRYGRPKRDISTIIHILNDLLCATPQYRRHTRQGHSISVEATGSTVPKKGTNTADKNASSLEYMEESGSLSRENQATRGKMEHLRLIMEERRARRRARREARAAPYTTQWSAKSESLPQSSAMGHDTVEPMETGEQSSSAASSEQQLCELNPPEPVVA